MPRKSRWRRVVITVTAMAVVLLLAAGFRFVQSRGIFASVEEKAPASCHAVANISGVTAMTSDAKAAIAYVATRQGQLYGWKDGKLAKLSGTPREFHPLALAVGRSPDGFAKLQSIFARNDGSYALAVFDVLPGKLMEIGRLTTDQITDPADLVSIDGTRFYLVNRHKSHTALGRWLDDAFLLPRANVLYYDGMKFITVAERLNSPSGIALSPDGSRLYVAQDLPRSLASFSRSEFSGALDNSALLGLSAGPRKITLAPDGSLIVAAWPKAGTGAVYRVRVDGGAPQAAELLYATKSHEITAAAEAGGHLLIGSDKRLLDCKL